ncbi:hypothetical protein RJ641_018048 [Dillenia turbinata]|uniref:Homer protein n=1 Tax=Dillenia turbinata TaxID=194707 RepID=A0AAN8YY75_9MAGN
MVEIQSCTTLINASALCAKTRNCALEFTAHTSRHEFQEQKVSGERESIIAEISAELEMERQKNAELMKRISMLEAQIKQREDSTTCLDGQGSCPNATGRKMKRFKRQRTETGPNPVEAENAKSIPANAEDENLEGHIVNRMSMDETQLLHFEKLQDTDSVADCDYTDDTNDEGHDFCDEKRLKENELDHSVAYEIKGCFPRTGLENLIGPENNEKVTRKMKECVASSAVLSSQKKPPKVPFCPKEVKRITESEDLSVKNAQSHTLRKIIVFASLGIRHGCEDMYELDFNHFGILKKGKPFVSEKNPGEHVLYENPGVRRKIFYPNRQNPVLCPVQVLEEEKAMRPSDASCPQRMGRNKLKSFGPLICQMAMLVHIRSGSFFFKALGITLLFMSGFSDDLVQKETKYRNLDLLQKYYRTDEDAAGEELFLPHQTDETTAPQTSEKFAGKPSSTKSRGKRQRSATSKANNVLQYATSTSLPTSQFGLTGYTSPWSHETAISNEVPETSTPTPTVPYHYQTPYHVFPLQTPNAFMPMMYWPPPQGYPPCPTPPSYSYWSFPFSRSHMPILSQPYFSLPPCDPFVPKVSGGFEKNEPASEDEDSDSGSSSTHSEPDKAMESKGYTRSFGTTIASEK